MLLMYVDGKGFVRDFDLSGAKLMYTTVIDQAQKFETRSQIRHTKITNGINHAVFSIEIGQVTDAVKA